ncbi:MAG: hypothetical protein ACK5OX_13110 [Desertimonas sp.]
MAPVELGMTLRHLSVGVAIAGTSLATLFGLTGEPLPERFDQKQITIAPTGDDGLRVREIVDQDFGTADRHGYQRIVPEDFGVPTDIVASSPDAPSDLSISSRADETVIRIGDPDRTISGQHRYELAYTYPAARLSTGRLGLDVIGVGDQETLRLELVVVGFELDDAVCSVGALDTRGGCELIRDGDVYRAVIEPLAAGDGVTIGADIVSVDRGRTIDDVEAPPLPERRSNAGRVGPAALIAVLGLITAVGAYQIAKRRGRNEVAGVGAVDAAYGDEVGDLARVRPPDTAFPPPDTPPVPGPERPPTTAGPVRLVADRDMGRLATIEFAPPPGVRPWQGAIALRERIDDQTAGAWFSAHAADGVLTMEKAGAAVTLSPGPDYGRASEADHRRLDQLFGEEPSIELGVYSLTFAEVWQQVLADEEKWAQQSGWWKHGVPRRGVGPAATIVAVVMAIGAGIGVFLVGRTIGLFDHMLAMVVLSIAFVATVASAVYHVLRAARSAAGSAVAIRTESFRRFLAASEARHVEWAWHHGLLREYSAWAVALGAAEGWQRALRTSEVPTAEYDVGPLIVHTAIRTFDQTRQRPSGEGNGGGYSDTGSGGGGGYVGGGGGGGSSGSW